MITIATLEKATEQQVFDQMAVHMLTQNQRSFMDDNETCAYRNGHELMCPAGCLFSDEEYKKIKPDDRGTWRTLVENELVPSYHCALISDVQSIHDQHEPHEWLTRLQGVIQRYGFSRDAIRPWLKGARHEG
jgi:hypothetical protein